MDPWPHSEAGRFHRVIALMLVAVAALVATVALARNHRVAEALALGGLLVSCAAVFRFLLRDLRAHPANFPGATATDDTDPSSHPAGTTGRVWRRRSAKAA